MELLRVGPSHKSIDQFSQQTIDTYIYIAIMMFARQRVTTTLKTIPEEQSEHFLNYITVDCSNDKPTSISTTSWAPAGIKSSQNDHHLANDSRGNHGLAPLERTVHLDELAQDHANSMAQGQSVFHSVNSVNELRHKLRSIHVGENILRGKTILKIHNEIMVQPTSFLRSNILCETFDQMGMGTALGKDDGLVYLVQVFRSTKE